MEFDNAWMNLHMQTRWIFFLFRNRFRWIAIIWSRIVVHVILYMNQYFITNVQTFQSFARLNASRIVVHLNHAMISTIIIIIFELKCEKNGVHSLNAGWIAFFFLSTKIIGLYWQIEHVFAVDFFRPFIDWPDLSVFVGFTFHNTFQSLQQVNTIFFVHFLFLSFVSFCTWNHWMVDLCVPKSI